MQKHIKLYMEGMGYDDTDFQPCELCRRPRNDVHHIESRGMGGNPLGDKDVIENLMGLCRVCHDAYGDKYQYKKKLKKYHLEFLEKRRRNERAFTEKASVITLK